MTLMKFSLYYFKLMQANAPSWVISSYPSSDKAYTMTADQSNSNSSKIMGSQQGKNNNIRGGIYYKNNYIIYNIRKKGLKFFFFPVLLIVEEC